MRQASNGACWQKRTPCLQATYNSAYGLRSHSRNCTRRSTVKASATQPSGLRVDVETFIHCQYSSLCWLSTFAHHYLSQSRLGYWQHWLTHERHSGLADTSPCPLLCPCVASWPNEPRMVSLQQVLWYALLRCGLSINVTWPSANAAGFLSPVHTDVWPSRRCMEETGTSFSLLSPFWRWVTLSAIEGKLSVKLCVCRILCVSMFAA